MDLRISEMTSEISDLTSGSQDPYAQLLYTVLYTVLYIVLYIGSVHRGNPPLDVDSGEYTCQTGESLCSEEILKGDI